MSLPAMPSPRPHLRSAALLAPALVGAILAGGACSSEPPGPRPPIVLITLDTTRADHLGCYGYEAYPTSPRIDELAQEGALFTQAIAQAAVTPVSHASILTGLNPFNHGVRVLHGSSQFRLGEEQVSLAEILREEGYATAAFVSALPVTEYFGFEQGFEVFDAAFAPDAAVERNVRGGQVNTGGVQRHAGGTTKRALEWMSAQEGPFFLWLHYFDPHDDRMMPPEAWTQGKQWSTETRARLREIYDVEIAYMDAAVGLVFERLKQLELWEEAVVVVTADHGEGLGDHDWWTHGILYQEQIRVPLIVRAPGMGEGERVDSVVRTIDIVPTLGDLLELGGGDLPSMDGVSLLPLMHGETEDLGLTAYADSVNLMVYRTTAEISDNKNDMLFAVIVEGRWKYIHHLKQTQESELYDLREDPGELRNLYTERPDVAERAHAALKEFEFMPYAQLEAENVPQAVLDGLKALGYMGSDEDVTEEDEKAGEDG